MRYSCCDRLRRNATAAHPTLNGLDWVEVLDRDAPPGGPRQRTLLVRLLKAAPPLDADNVRVTGGERVRDPDVMWVERAEDVPAARAGPAERAFYAALPEADHVLVARTAEYGDFSPYTLALVRSPLDARAPAGFDPMLAAIEFTFKIDCPSDFDCRAAPVCPKPSVPAPEIDYLAKDYASFRRLLLDRITQLLPEWRERNAADLGVALVELAAYAGDHLSYQQDAVATEAYLDSARRRVSVRRHALLVDYFMHDGCNARAWVFVETASDGVPIGPGDLSFASGVEGLDARIDPGSTAVQRIIGAGAAWFEPMESITLWIEHNELRFYTWGDERCCLPRGATRATLAGHRQHLAPGQVLVFEEVRGPATGQAADADPRHRHAVRLRTVVHTEEGAPLVDPLNGEPITEISWDAEDALPFPLCISSRTDEEHGAEFVPDVSVARGNIVLADHGRIVGESLGEAPAPRLRLARPDTGDPCDRPPRPAVPPRFRPQLASAPLTQQGAVLKVETTPAGRRERFVPFDRDASAAAATSWEMRDVRPAIELDSVLGADVGLWTAMRDLLASEPHAREFVVEIEADGATRLRFGDGEHGERPRTDTAFTARYRTGNGTAGNVGADAVAHAITADGRIVRARNPLAARGGREPERVEEARRRASQAFRTQERAVTPEDYAAVAERHAGVQRAAATTRWTGSWHTVFLTVDRLGAQPLAPSFEAALARHVERYRMAGHDLEFDEPRFVPLEVELFVCVKPDYFRADVKARLAAELGSGTLPDGRRGLFHPDNFTFGQTIYLSPILAAAHAVPGVASASAVKFQRQGIEDKRTLEDGRMTLGRLEIGRLDNDRNHPERGVLRVALGGGK